MESNRPRKIVFEVGQKIGNLTILEEVYLDGKRAYKCDCSCGNTVDISVYSLNTGKKVDCGCTPRRGQKVPFKPGDKKGKLTVLEFVRVGTLRGYKCQCECGNVVDIPAGFLNYPKRKTCGCSQGKSDEENHAYYIGKKFNKVFIHSFAYKSKHNDLHYNYTCDCGNIGVISKSRIGINESCGCVAIQKKKTGCEEISGHYWGRVKRHAKSRNIDVEITVEQAWNKFLEQRRKCVYTGRVLVFGNSTKKIPQTASLDRIDSDKDYTLDNIQWVHKEVNLAKHILSNDAFIQLCQEVVNHSKNGDN